MGTAAAPLLPSHTIRWHFPSFVLLQYVMEAEYGDEPSQLHYVFIFAGLWVWVWVVMATKKRLSLYTCGKRGRQSHGVNSELESGRKEIIIDHKRCFSFGSSTWNLKGTPLESLDIV